MAFWNCRCRAGPPGACAEPDNTLGGLKPRGDCFDWRAAPHLAGAIRKLRQSTHPKSNIVDGWIGGGLPQRRQAMHRQQRAQHIVVRTLFGAREDCRFVRPVTPSEA